MIRKSVEFDMLSLRHLNSVTIITMKGFVIFFRKKGKNKYIDIIKCGCHDFFIDYFTSSKAINSLMCKEFY